MTWGMNTHLVVHKREWTPSPPPTHIHPHLHTMTWGMNSHLVVHKDRCEPPAQCNSPSATNGYSCPSLMPGSISTSNTFSSGTNLKHKQQGYTQTFHCQLKGQKELGLGHTQTSHTHSQLKGQKELGLGHTQTSHSQLKGQKELGLGHTQTFHSHLKWQKEWGLGHTQTFHSHLKRQKELEQRHHCFLAPIQKGDDVLRKKYQASDRTTKGLLRQFANQLCVYLMGQLI